MALFYIFQMSLSSDLEEDAWIQCIVLAGNLQALEISLYTLKDESDERQ